MFIFLKIIFCFLLLVSYGIALAEPTLILPQQSSESNSAVTLELKKLQYFDSISGVKPLDPENQFLVIDITVLNAISPELVFDHDVAEKLVFHHLGINGPFLQWGSEQVFGRIDPKRFKSIDHFPDPAYLNYEGDSLSGKLIYEIPRKKPETGASLLWPDSRFDLLALDLFEKSETAQIDPSLYETNGEYNLRIHDVDIQADGVSFSLSGYRNTSKPTIMSEKGTAQPLVNFSLSSLFVDGAAKKPEFPGDTTPVVFVSDRVLTHKMWYPTVEGNKVSDLGLVIFVQPPKDIKDEPYWIIPIKGAPSIANYKSQVGIFENTSADNKDLEPEEKVSTSKEDISLEISEEEKIQKRKDQNEQRRRLILSCNITSPNEPKQITTEKLLLSNIIFDGKSCIDVYPKGDGWGWNGTKTCRPNGHVYFFEDFEDEMELWNKSKLNYLPFSDFCVQGAVDLLKDKQFPRKDRKPLTCHGGSGCVDLDGSLYLDKPAAVMTSRTVEIDPGEYVLKFDVSGNLRNQIAETISLSFEPHLTEVTFVIEPEMEVKTKKMTFSVDESTQSKLVVKLLEAADYVGPIIDNIEISRFRENGWLSVVSHSSDTSEPISDTKTSSPNGLTAIEVIFDASGSMWKKMPDGRTRIEVARSVLSKLITESMPDKVPFALRVFGNRKARSCQTDLEYSLKPLNRNNILSTINKISPKNRSKTPIAKSLSLVKKDLEKVSGNRVVILLTDGKETCDGDPKKEIEKLKSLGIGLQINIVGFAIDDEKLQKQFKEYAQIGGGQYFSAINEAELRLSLDSAVKPMYRVYDDKNNLVATGRVNDEAHELLPGEYRVEFSDKSRAVETIEIISGKDLSVEY